LRFRAVIYFAILAILLLALLVPLFAQKGGKVIQHVEVYREEGRFAGWPANHGAWSWGNELLFGFEIGHYKENPRRTHAIDYEQPAEHVLARSLDGGETWTIERPAGLQPPANVKVAGIPTGDTGNELKDCPGGIDFTAPGFIFTARMTSIHTGPSHFYYSQDKGKSWEGPFRLPDMRTPGIAARTDYRVLGKHEMMVFLTAAKQNEKEGKVIAAITKDGAKTWEFVANVTTEPPGNDYAIMPSTVRLFGDTLLMGVRRRNYIAAFQSDNGGYRWSPKGKIVENTGLGNPPALARLPDGRIVCTYGYRAKPFGIRARISPDLGNTWSRDLMLRADGAGVDLGYTRTFVRTDGNLVTVYYYWDKKSPERYIGATIWDPGSREVQYSRPRRSNDSSARP
jgi:hypothetical protein